MTSKHQGMIKYKNIFSNYKIRTSLILIKFTNLTPNIPEKLRNNAAKSRNAQIQSIDML